MQAYTSPRVEQGFRMSSSVMATIGSTGSFKFSESLNYELFRNSQGPLKQGDRAGRRVSFICNSTSKAKPTSSMAVEQRDIVNGSSVSPVYLPTPPNRDLRTPHSGYHFDGSTRRFFEGWYFKVSIPEKKQSFCFMYTVENPAFPRKLNPVEEAQFGRLFTGVGAQILGADDKYICQYSEESRNFWGSRHELVLGNAFTARTSLQPPSKEVPPEEFNRKVLEGFQVSPLWNQGFICDDGRSNYVETVKTARWQYSTRPIYGWGNVGSKQKSTAGWLATFPVFEPHWQICMAAGLSTGWIEWDGERFEFLDAPSYSEKNWGGAFPRKWFWIQCNVFEGASGEVALTAAGGLRQLPRENFENAALVELEATTEDPGTTLRAPTREAGLAPACKDTCYGLLKLQMWERRSDGSKGKVILDVTSDMAAVEVGGGPWFSSWRGKTSSPELLSRALSLPVDVDSVFGLVPFLKPPGL
ncbi:hypothetical protein Nepgr_012645 [Nepenthes gracilis]|uniref:Tocopherol cyclase n=1 Tax=Nepenthes gracilis TaxID=150966 RepID=A0AAD3SHN2_NEPGR|nr:hypothetical protein Nepgr_012645 [Nepenthes gracilis]